MQKEFTIMLDEDLQKRFEIALQLDHENQETVIETLIRSYVSQAFARAAAAYEQPDVFSVVKENGTYYGKAIHRIPKWAKKQNQINHKIIRAFFQLAEHGTVTYQALASRCHDEACPDVYVPTFSSNFAQMKFDGDKSHGKVFEVSDEGVVTIWDVVAATLMQFKKSFLFHSTDVNFVNNYHQRNLGKTGLQGTDHMQYLYAMRCDDCGYEYYSNGSSIFEKRCPKCQGGVDTGKSINADS